MPLLHRNPNTGKTTSVTVETGSLSIVSRSDGTLLLGRIFGQDPLALREVNYFRDLEAFAQAHACDQFRFGRKGSVTINGPTMTDDDMHFRVAAHSSVPVWDDQGRHLLLKRLMTPVDVVAILHVDGYHYYSQGQVGHVQIVARVVALKLVTPSLDDVLPTHKMFTGIVKSGSPLGQALKRTISAMGNGESSGTIPRTEEEWARGNRDSREPTPIPEDDTVMGGEAEPVPRDPTPVPEPSPEPSPPPEEACPVPAEEAGDFDEDKELDEIVGEIGESLLSKRAVNAAKKQAIEAPSA